VVRRSDGRVCSGGQGDRREDAVRVEVFLGRAQAICVGAEGVGDLFVVGGAQQIGIATRKGVWGQLRGDGVGPGQVSGWGIVRLPRSEDFDHVMGLADAERGGLKGRPGGGAVKVVHGNR
jgi:hypothetical protein